MKTTSASIVRPGSGLVRPMLAGLLWLCCFAPGLAGAVIVSIDDPGGFGVDALTRDTDQGLDFLDITFSFDRSWNDVSGEFGVGGDYEGFRYATLNEVTTLANNFGAMPALTPGVTAFIDTNIGGLVDLLGWGSSTAFNRTAVAMTGTVSPTGADFRRMVEFLDEFDDLLFDDRITMEAAFSAQVDTTAETRGSYLVREATTEVALPGTLGLMLVGTLALWRGRTH